MMMLEKKKKCFNNLKLNSQNDIVEHDQSKESQLNAGTEGLHQCFKKQEDDNPSCDQEGQIRVEDKMGVI